MNWYSWWLLNRSMMSLLLTQKMIDRCCVYFSELVLDVHNLIILKFPIQFILASEFLILTSASPCTVSGFVVYTTKFCARKRTCVKRSQFSFLIDWSLSLSHRKDCIKTENHGKFYKTTVIWTLSFISGRCFSPWWACTSRIPPPKAMVDFLQQCYRRCC